jgi:hypothetical protein
LAPLQGQRVASLVVVDAVSPAAVEDAGPLEGESAKGSLVLRAASSATLIEGVGPEGARDGLPDPFYEGLAEEGGAAIAPMDGGFVATALGDWSDAGVLLERGASQSRGFSDKTRGCSRLSQTSDYSRSRTAILSQDREWLRSCRLLSTGGCGGLPIRVGYGAESRDTCQ